jgi:hypothetical protein
MSIQQLLLGAAGASGYNLQRSVRLRSSASAFLNRTPASAGNRQTWTWSAWVKRGQLGVLKQLFSAGSGTTTFQMYFNGSGGGASSTDGIELFANNSGTQVLYYTSTAVRRDPSAWYHIVLAVDTTQATAGNRVLLYVNGASVTDITGVTVPAQNTNLVVNSIAAHNIGQFNSANYFDGYMAEVNFIDGQALTPASFGSTNALTGVWQPAPYTGTYGTNGFYLKFTDNSTAAALGTDFSGNSNTWTVNNISITAGVTYDSMTDVPTLTSATAANYAVWNPLVSIGNEVFSNGNLTATNGTSGASTSTMPVSLGKYYAEFSPSVLGSTTGRLIGIFAYSAGDSLAQYIAKCVAYQPDGTKRINSTISSYGASYTTADVIGVSLDLDNNTIEFFKNNISQGVIDTTLSQPAGTLWTFGSAQGGSISSSVVANFGQRPFAYTPPTGFVALNAFNLPASTIVKGNTVMDATLYTGTLLSNSITNAAAFQPDLVWIKSRSAATDHELTDSVRGVTLSLTSNSTAAEATDVQGLTAFNANGFTVGTNTNYNNLAATYVGWQWKAGGAAVTNTDGSITSSVSVNASAGFSVVTYTGTGANATVGHGLGVAPSMIIFKRRNSTSNWPVYHASTGNTGGLYLNGTNAFTVGVAFWNNTSPTSTVFTLGGANEVNVSTATNVAYCFAEIAGFSKFGSYTGNANANGPFVYTGFRPRFVLMKRTDSISAWYINDTSRSPANDTTGDDLQPNSTNAEGGTVPIDILSNGFKIRTLNNSRNASGGTFIYMALAENPFKFSLAR